MLNTMRRNSLIITLVLVASLDGTSAKVFGRCELANTLKNMPDVLPQHISTWVCIAYHESRFDTAAIGRGNGDWSWDHGLFQLSDRYWCGRDRVGGACRLPCESLRNDDITDDMKCMRIIFDEHKHLSGDGFNAWAVYGKCQSPRVDKYISGCFDGYEINAFNRL